MGFEVQGLGPMWDMGYVGRINKVFDEHPPNDLLEIMERKWQLLCCDFGRWMHVLGVKGLLCTVQEAYGVW